MFHVGSTSMPAQLPATASEVRARTSAATTTTTNLSSGVGASADNSHRARGALLRYGFSAACSILTTAITVVFWNSLFQRNPFALFFAAVMISAWYGGFGPGLVATAVSVWAVNTFVLPSFASTFE